MKEIVLNGDSFEIGRQHGAFLKNQIQGFLDKGFAQINTLSKRNISVNNLAGYVLPYAEIINKELPEFYLEISGIASGADISLEEAMLLQVRRELIGTGAFTLTGDCSSIGCFKNKETVVAQTIDLNGDMTALGNVFKIAKTGKSTIMQYSFAGLLGYMGMNDAGLALAINLVVSDGWRVGIPPYLVARKFLECSSVESCLDVLNTLTIASSRSFLIADNNRLVNVEITPKSYCVEEAVSLSHTNHFVNRDFLHSDKLNIFSKNSSVKRKILLDNYLKVNQDEIAIRNAFMDHSLFPTGICAHSKGDVRHNETVAAVIMYPQQRKFLALKGKPCVNNYILYNL